MRAPLRSRGLIWNPELGIKINFMYHPEDITEEKSLDWRTIPILGVSQPLLSYGGGELRTMRFRILLDAHASPHPAGHVEGDLRLLRTLSVPFDIEKTPTVRIPESPIGSGTYAGSMAPRGPGRVAGVPPVVKLAFGGRVVKGVLQHITIQEVLHGTTPQSRPQRACTRAWVEFRFIVIEDNRMLIHWTPQQPTGGP